MSAGRGPEWRRSRHVLRAKRVLTSSHLHAPVIAALALAFAAPALSGAPRTADDRLQALGDEFVARSLARDPHAATRPGAPNGDHLLPPVTAARLAEDLAWQRDFRARLATVRRQDLTPDRALERDLLAARVERELLQLEVIRPFERDPGAYLPLVAGAIQMVMERPSTSPCQRVQLAARRLSQVPEVLRAARLNLRNPPRLLTEAAIAEFAGVLRFYREAVPGMASGCRNARLQADLAQADTTAVRAVKEFLLYLKEDLLPASRADVAIGPDACRRLLGALFLDDVAPVETLLAQGERAIDERRAELESLAPLVALGGLRAAFDSLAAGGPEEGALVPWLEQRILHVRAFLRDRDLVTLPERVMLGVREARPFRRGLATTSLDAGGVGEPRGEPRAAEAWLEVTPPDSSLDEADRRLHLARFNRWETDLAVVHEGLPGRYLRGMALHGSTSRLREILQSAWSAEDWGLYCEWMMLAEGYGADDPRYRFAAAARALRSAGRSFAALGLHAGARSLDEVRHLLEDRCLLSPDDAAREVLRGAADPDLMGYTLGAGQLLALRDQALRMMGPRFRIKLFNDAVLRCGASPPGIVRRELGVAEDGTPVGVKP